MAIELVKENIDYEQLLGENTADTVVKNEYLISDTNPDVYEILLLDTKPSIINKEIMQDKVYIEGQLEYNVIYLTKEDEKFAVYNVVYFSKFADYVELPGADHKMTCEAEALIEHMECGIINERKISIEGIIKLKTEVYRQCNYEIVKDISGVDDIQLLKNPTSIDKIAGNASSDLVAKCSVNIPMDKPQIGSIVKCNVNIHKREVKIFEGKIQYGAFADIKVLYKAKDTRELCLAEDDVHIDGENEILGVEPSMSSFDNFTVDNIQLDIKEDDLGERRILDIEALVKADSKVLAKEETDMIEDAYSPSLLMNMEKNDYVLNVLHGHASSETVVKGEIEVPEDEPKAAKVLICSGKVSITDKKLVEDKVVIDGIVKVDVIYETSDEDRYIGAVSEELPFSYGVEIAGTKIDMHCTGKVFLESVTAAIEAGTIAVKAIVNVEAKVNYLKHKEFLVNVTETEEEIPRKKASIIIYVVQPSDTLWKIAKKYSTTIDNLIRINEIENTDNIKAGTKIIIPGSAII